VGRIRVRSRRHSPGIGREATYHDETRPLNIVR
jgi:hypothetical protein